MTSRRRCSFPATLLQPFEKVGTLRIVAENDVLFGVFTVSCNLVTAEVVAYRQRPYVGESERVVRVFAVLFSPFCNLVTFFFNSETEQKKKPTVRFSREAGSRERLQKHRFGTDDSRLRRRVQCSRRCNLCEKIAAGLQKGCMCSQGLQGLRGSCW